MRVCIENESRRQTKVKDKKEDESKERKYE